ncbi:MAG: undecaprenyl/decaprenyl-phosphate alpha-N-acetylglucosaminyl 1-phosphate transferase [Candidatus Omnitrophica bacterium]|nr:undecaprenyl/decaprenyl-phosphate alpha-N-acetylglucosaminyl 1-phosphate transferase [Candidatus Omnitrophota bacterium]
MGKRVYAERIRLHEKGVPRLGGLALYLAFYAVLLSFYIFKRDILQEYDTKLLGIFLASTILIICGLYDDLVKRLSYKIKFALQFLAAIIVIVFGYNINILTNPFNGEIYIGILGIPLLILWMVMIMNAINLMDGLDGLAGGISIIVFFSFFVIGFYRGNVFSMIIIASLIGAGIGFLRYNFYPAKLFLGDSGSFFLGFMIGILALENSTKRATVISLIVPFLTVFIPLASVTFTFSRRIAYAKNPFRPDRKHMHYRLLRAGISHRDTVLLYYTVTFLYAALGVLCFFMPKKFEFSIIAFAVIAIWGLYMWALHFVSLKERLQRKRH